MEAFQNVLDGAGFDADEKDTIFKETVKKDEFLPMDIEEDVDFEETATDLQVIDAINRHRQLALMVQLYAHVKHHTPVPFIFDPERATFKEEAPRFHL